MKILVFSLLAMAMGVVASAATVVLSDGTVVSDVDGDSVTALDSEENVGVSMFGDEACIAVVGTLDGFTVHRADGAARFGVEVSRDPSCGLFFDPVVFEARDGVASVVFDFPATEVVSLFSFSIPEPVTIGFLCVAILGVFFGRRRREWPGLLATGLFLAFPGRTEAQFDIDAGRYRHVTAAAMPEARVFNREAWRKLDFSGVSLGSKTITLLHNRYTKHQRFGLTAKHYSSPWRIGRSVPFRDRARKSHYLKIAAV